jgi:hypothetical protein
MIGKAALVAGAATLLSAATPLAAEETVGVPPPVPAGWTAPKTEWGDPDLRGTYRSTRSAARRCSAGRSTATGC